MGKICYIGHRCLLEYNHPFRFIGSSKQCCPQGYYDGTNESLEPLKKIISDCILDPSSFLSANKQAQPSVMAADSVARRRPCDGNEAYCQFKNAMVLKNLHNYKAGEAEWIVGDFVKYMCFAHMDLRPPKTYIRTTDADFSKLAFDQSHIQKKADEVVVDKEMNDGDGEEADDRSSDTDSSIQATEEPKRAKSSSVGVHAMWVYFLLPSASICAALFYDSFHALKNLMKDTFCIFKGESIGATHKSVLLGFIEGRFPTIVPKVGRRIVETDVKKGNEKSNNNKRAKYNTISSDLSNSNTCSISNGSNISSSDTSTKAPEEKYEYYFDFTKAKLPWVINQKERFYLETAHNCINTPVGLVGFSAKNVMSSSGKLIGHDTIQFMTTFMNFGLSFTTIPAEYKNMFAVVSRVTADMLSPVLSTNTNMFNNTSVLLKRVAEMLSLFESMLPDADQQFTHHQLIDIVVGMDAFGPLRNWWTYAGERFMKIVKDYCPQGGVNPLKTIYDYYAADENSQRYTFIEDYKLHYDNNGKYCDNMIKLLNSEHLRDECWSPWLLENLLSQVYNFINTQEIDAKQLKSPFFRVYASYLFALPFLKKKLQTNECFHLWAKLVLDFASSGRIHKEQQHFLGHLYPMDCLPLDADSVTAAIACGSVYSVDLPTLKHMQSLRPERISTKGIVKGLSKFTFRGQHFSETKAPDHDTNDEVFRPNNELNRLFLNFHRENQYSSWCKVTDWMLRYGRISYVFRYGQLNYIFRLKLPDDSILHNIPMVNITLRTDNTPNKKIPLPRVPLAMNGTHTNRYESSYNPLFQFIVANYVVSTNVGTCCVNSDNVPVQRADLAQGSWRRVDHKIDTCLENASSLYLIDLHPHRRFVDISIEDSKIIERPL